MTTETHAELLQRTNNITANLGVPGEWPRRELFPLMALAQHYGFPTRLLDWSGDPLASAYFAASRGINYLDEPGRSIGVWQTYASVLRQTQLSFAAASGRPSTTRYIAIVDAPYTGNPNLAAQKGRFTVAIEKHEKLVDTWNAPLEPVRCRSLQPTAPAALPFSFFAMPQQAPPPPTTPTTVRNLHSFSV